VTRIDRMTRDFESDRSWRNVTRRDTHDPRIYRNLINRFDRPRNRDCHASHAW